MRAGHVGESADHQAWTRKNSGIDAVAHSAHVLGQQAARAGKAQIAQGRKAHFKAQLRVKQRIKLLEFRRYLPLRNPIVLERPVVEHAQVDVQIHHARHQCAMAGVNHFGLLRNQHLTVRSNRFDAFPFQQDNRILQNGSAIAVDKGLSLDCLYARAVHRMALSCWLTRKHMPSNAGRLECAQLASIRYMRFIAALNWAKVSALIFPGLNCRFGGRKVKSAGLASISGRSSWCVMNTMRERRSSLGHRSSSSGAWNRCCTACTTA